MRRMRSGFEVGLRETRHEIDELRIELKNMSEIFAKYSKQLSKTVAATNAMLEKATAMSYEARRAVISNSRLKKVAEDEKYDHHKSVQGLIEVVQGEIRAVEKAQVDLRRKTLLDKREAKFKEKQRHASLGTLTDDEELEMKRRLQALKKEMHTKKKAVDNKHAKVITVQTAFAQMLAYLDAKEKGLSNVQREKAVAKVHMYDEERIKAIDLGPSTIQFIVKSFLGEEDKLFDLSQAVRRTNERVHAEGVAKRKADSALEEFMKGINAASESKLQRQRALSSELEKTRSSSRAFAESAVQHRKTAEMICDGIKALLRTRSV